MSHSEWKAPLSVYKTVNHLQMFIFNSFFLRFFLWAIRVSLDNTCHWHKSYSVRTFCNPRQFCMEKTLLMRHQRWYVQHLLFKETEALFDLPLSDAFIHLDSRYTAEDWKSPLSQNMLYPYFLQSSSVIQDFPLPTMALARETSMRTRI